ncbi:TRAP transporter substrate-binding protein DctP [Streptomyces cinnabarinus]|uniref:TRAP transporter substrate-binding protein DctP n=1 Tax=Streptomyces cinnabarinus TaxID=67287 RepID=A0ABY7KM84_9ACTN|nr:TRAP transporter substrate-binding protein DctP [Streptomyces cinnabarinus]WAZ25667.1 TRAP transporter substrate-binding protein DctP [Streptomyces cinnabarinus]
MSMRRWGRRSAAAVLAAVVAAGCTTADGQGDKAGGPGAPRVLTLANGYANLDYEPAVAYFVDRVDEVSGGALRIEVAHEWGDFAVDSEQRVVRDVAAGRADLGWAGTRAFDSLGVRGFQALTAPLLVDSHALQRAVLDSGIPERMLPDLKPLGVTGLALLADGLRRPVGVRKPLLGPADWRGIAFGTARSEAQSSALRGLGAEPFEGMGPIRDRALEQGRIDGFEMYLIGHHINNYALRAPYITANVHLWPQTAALIADTDLLGGLTGAQRDWLREAAADAARRSPQLSDQDGELVVQLCESGVRFALASAADLKGLRDALRPEYARLGQDGRTKSFIAEIERLKARLPRQPALDVPADCLAQRAR